ncbi:MAG: hypothetical protein AABY86_18295, partial [Bdellovibrionota bacterium]
MNPMSPKTYTWEFFCKSLTPGVREKLEAIMDRGMSLCLVGGASRQWILNQSLPFDLDFEIRPLESKNLEILIEEVSNLLKAIFGNIRPMPFHVFIVETMDMGHVFQLEFSLPRREIYCATKTAHGFGHSDFEVQIDPCMTYAESFARRDFTINAVGLEFKLEASDHRVTVQDPHQGLEDLAGKILRPIGETFYYDPVRFLRMIRFQLSLDFSLHPSLKQKMNKFNLHKITLHYFLREAFKTNFFNFIKLFFRYAEECQLELPSFLQTLKSLALMPSTNLPLPHSPLQLAVVIA